jgi:SAM-dependent MidA family methyltransferase
MGAVMDDSTPSVASGGHEVSPAWQRLLRAHADGEGWLPFDGFMAQALYAPGMGYYSRGLPVLGQSARDGSDFVTAPELSPAFAMTLAHQVAQWLQATGVQRVVEFGAGSGALAEGLLDALDQLDAGLASGKLQRYEVVEVSASMRQQQQRRLAKWGQAVQWLDAWPASLEAVVLGNEVLDAMPVKLLQRVDGVWHELGVSCRGAALAWQTRPTELRPPVPVVGTHDYRTELPLQAVAWTRELAQRLQRGVALLVDYGFAQAEFYHPQRHGGTVMCHRAHQADDNPLSDVGSKDITAHVDFTAVALAAQEAGQEVVGYTSQGRFLLNCGLLDVTQTLPLAQRGRALALVHEHEMGELFKVLAFAPAAHQLVWQSMGFAQGDRSHTL